MKKKKILITILSFICISVAHASSGSAIAPYFMKKEGAAYTTVNVTNVANEIVTVFIRIYDSNGNLYTEETESDQNISIEENFIGDPLSDQGGELSPMKRGSIRLKPAGDYRGGIVVIEWVSDGANTSALVGFAGKVTIKENEANDALILPINGGLPF